MKYTLGLILIIALGLFVVFENENITLPSKSNIYIDGVGEVVVGETLLHPKFGKGELKQIQDGGEGVIILQLEFPDHGTKFLVSEYANLKKT